MKMVNWSNLVILMALTPTSAKPAVRNAYYLSKQTRELTSEASSKRHNVPSSTESHSVPKSAKRSTGKPRSTVSKPDSSPMSTKTPPSHSVVATKVKSAKSKNAKSLKKIKSTAGIEYEFGRDYDLHILDLIFSYDMSSMSMSMSMSMPSMSMSMPSVYFDMSDNEVDGHSNKSSKDSSEHVSAIVQVEHTHAEESTVVSTTSAQVTSDVVKTSDASPDSDLSSVEDVSTLHSEVNSTNDNSNVGAVGYASAGVIVVVAVGAILYSRRRPSAALPSDVFTDDIA